MSELTAHLDLPGGVDALTAAREVTRTVLTGWRLGDLQWVDDAVLIADELVANAVRHGGGCPRLYIHADGTSVTIAAVDGSAIVPRRRDPDRDGGRGLAIIEALGAEWGVTDFSDGHKRVWARLTAPSTATAD
ncbi:ATP-binding protein [Micromonospora sp. WMMD1274]|uniref:ATP-binding protein n=1 Tax=Micromonospora sp. WMMD1274 TaxID=3404116 RepID=UPI003B94F3F9